MNRTASMLIGCLILATVPAAAATPANISEGAAPVVPPGNTVVRIGNPDAAPRTWRPTATAPSTWATEPSPRAD